MELSWEIYIRIGKDSESVPIESINSEKRNKIGKELNDTFFRVAGYTPVKENIMLKT